MNMIERAPGQDGDEPGAATAPLGREPINVSRRHVFMGLSLLAVSGLAYARRPRRLYPEISKEKFEALFPKTFGDWQTSPVSELVMPPESQLADKLYEHILTRTYVNSNGDAVMFLAAYNSEQIDSVQVHRPEICYNASGFDIDLSEPVLVDVGSNIHVPARNVKAVRPTRTENILYWTRIGGSFPQSWAMQRVAMTESNIEGYYADGLLLRLSVIEGNNDRAIAKLTSFARDLTAHSGPQTREMLYRV